MLAVLCGTVSAYPTEGTVQRPGPSYLVGDTFLARGKSRSRGVACGAVTYRWPDGGGELIVYQDHQAGADLPPKPALFHHGRREDGSTPRDVLAAGRRARCRVRRLARHGGYRWMWTLTFPVAVHDRQEAGRLLHEFMKGRRHDPTGAGARLFGGAYIAVPELHKTHGWHWHVLTNRRVQVQGVLTAWTVFADAVGLLGAAKWARVHVKEFDAARSASAYASKYVTKAVEGGELDGRHRYRVGEQVEAPCPSYGLELGVDVWEVALRVGQESAGALWSSARLFGVKSAGPPCVWVGW